MEIVLGIDNIVFIAIIAGKLPVHQREKARLVGLSLALITRIALLTTVTWIMSAAKTTLFSIPYLPEVDENGQHIVNTVNGKDLILLLGGAFLIFKATREIHHNIEGEKQNVGSKAPTSFWSTIFLILVIDLVFSIDSVVTAVGMARSLEVMIAAVVISVIIMLAFSGYITRFIDKHKTLKMLALSFLLLIGVVLVADGLGQHINKGYIYFAMAFSVCVEMLNMKARPKPAA
ncbi:MAG: TerC family protein [Planctomycetes bacterium]|nr:TerC family protein [Planctomycetota bacterium]